MSDFAVVRRKNLHALYKQFTLKRVGAGESPLGVAGEFAQAIDVANSTLSALKGEGKSVRNIGDRLARQIESRLGLASGWLDEDHGEPEEPSPAQEKFIEAAREWYQRASSKERREMLHRFKGG